MTLSRWLTEAIAELEAQGYVILRAKSYHQAQERQRVAEALRASEAEHAASTTAWAHRAFDSQREAWDRTTYLYTLAASLGATDEQLHRTRVEWPTEGDSSPPRYNDRESPKTDVSGRHLSGEGETT